MSRNTIVCTKPRPLMAVIAAALLGGMVSASAQAITSEATMAVMGRAPTVTTSNEAVTIADNAANGGVKGLLDTGDIMTVDDSKLHGTDLDSDDVTFSYQWQRGGQPIASATNNSYTLVPADTGKTITLEVTPHTDATTTDPDVGSVVQAKFKGNASLGISNGAESITVPATGTLYSVVISGAGAAGRPIVGTSLSADATCSGSVPCDTSKLRYQWMIESPAKSGQYVNVATQGTGQTYTPTKDDQKKAIKVEVTMSTTSTTRR